MQDFTYGHGKVSKERPPAPLTWRRTLFGNPPVAMTWHHIVPFHALRNCWNALANHQRDSAKAKVALHIYLRILGFDHEKAKRLLAVMADGQLGLDSQEAVAVAVSYPKWDIVEGPDNRTDDPAEAFDEFSAGLSGTEQLRQEKLKELYLALMNFNEASVAVEVIDEAVFNDIATKMSLLERTLLSCTKVISFRESMWRMIEIPGQLKTIPAAAQWKKKRALKPGTPTPSA